MAIRIGIDLGGSKIEAIALEGSREAYRKRVPTPRGDYPGTLVSIASLVHEIGEGSVGIGIPGALSRVTGLVKNANSTWLIGKPLKQDLERTLGREVRVENDANCFALSEALDGAGAGRSVVFGAILGTGVGGGIVVGGMVLNGHHGIGGEWGHTPLPWMSREEHPGPTCNCGRRGCIEQWCSGPALARDTAARGEDEALAIYADRLARAFSLVINFLDPEIIVVGGGVSREPRLYASVPQLLPRYVYSPVVETPIVPAKFGDASGVRGAAMLWK